MAVTYVNGMEIIYGENPKMEGSDWASEYPPIDSSVRWLINKYTGEIFPNSPEFSTRSDILKPYMGDPFNKCSTVNAVADVLAGDTPASESAGDLAI